MLITIAFSSCKSSKTLIFYDNTLENNICMAIENDSILAKSYTGFCLYDISANREIININGNKFFTPASNTKILTFYTALKLLKDSMPVIGYRIINDSLIIWGLGNPTLFNNDFSRSHASLANLLKDRDTIYFSDANYKDQRYGEGWAWDDYQYYFQAEKSPFPLFGNKLNVDFYNDSIFCHPEFIGQNINISSDSFVYSRLIDENSFTIGKFKSGKNLNIPLRMDRNLIKKSFEKLYNVQVIFYDRTLENYNNSRRIYEPINDTLYLRLLQNSDNFIAEQLILMCSSKLFKDSLETKNTLEWSIENLMPYLKNDCNWIDGSGLSRYNLFTPLQIVRTLSKIRENIGDNRIRNLFLKINIENSIDNNSPLQSGIWAKTGTLNGVFNLSGYIYSNKGKIYAFSFMNNNFIEKNSKIKNSMKRVLNIIVNE